MFKRLVLASLLAVTAASSAAATDFQIDPRHTQVEFTYSHFGFSNITGRFADVAGTLSYDPADLAAAKLDVTVPLSGLSTGVPDLDTHLRSADFFDAEKFPAATFVSTGVTAAGEGRLAVAGDLTIHGVTRPVVLAVTVNKVGPHPMTGKQVAGFDATVTIKRSDFGVALYAPNVSDEVRIDITVEAGAAQ